MKYHTHDERYYTEDEFRTGKITEDINLGGQLEISGASRVIAETDTAQDVDDSDYTVIIYEDENEDNLSEYNTTTGIFTALKAGFYSVFASARFETDSWSAGDRVYLDLYKNGSLECGLFMHEIEAAGSFYEAMQGSAIVELSVGNTLSIRAYQVSGATHTIDTNAYFNRLSIHRMS